MGLDLIISLEDTEEQRTDNFKKIQSLINKKKGSKRFINKILEDLHNYMFGSREIEELLEEDYIETIRNNKLLESYVKYVRRLISLKGVKFNRYKFLLHRVEYYFQLETTIFVKSVTRSSFEYNITKEIIKIVRKFKNEKRLNNLLLSVLIKFIEKNYARLRSVLFTLFYNFLKETWTKKEFEYDRKRFLVYYYNLKALPRGGVLGYTLTPDYLPLDRRNLEKTLIYLMHSMSFYNYYFFRDVFLETIKRNFTNPQLVYNKLVKTRIIRKGKRNFYTKRPIYSDWDDSAWRGGKYLGFDNIKKDIEQIHDEYYDNPYSYAYIKGKSLIMCAEQHRNARVIMKCDIKRFFETISYEMLEEELLKYLDNERVSYILEFATYDGYLRLGLELSPMLSNIIAKKIDDNIAELINSPPFNKYGFIYTRYSDDMIFSSKSNEKIPFDNIIDEIDKILKSHGFLLNNKKTKVLSQKSNMNVLGVSLNQNRFTVTQKYRKKIRATIHSLINKKKNLESENKILEDLFDKLDNIGSLKSKVREQIENENPKVTRWESRFYRILEEDPRYITLAQQEEEIDFKTSQQQTKVNEIRKTYSLTKVRIKGSISYIHSVNPEQANKLNKFYNEILAKVEG
jgi:hypothetical protein